MGSKCSDPGQADAFDGLGRKGHNGNDQSRTASCTHHKSGTQPGQLDIAHRRRSRSRPSRSRRKVRKPHLACAFVDRHLYARQSARHVQDYPAVLTSHFTNDKFPTAESVAAAGSPCFFIGSISSEKSAPTTSSPAERKNGS